ncbi:MAG: signal recognition particle-docking protein FtsY [Succinivibrio sp.]|nr:signal recognition particle-docking protein FtsY [Succinivibrio sp.]
MAKGFFGLFSKKNKTQTQQQQSEDQSNLLEKKQQETVLKESETEQSGLPDNHISVIAESVPTSEADENGIIDSKRDKADVLSQENEKTSKNSESNTALEATSEIASEATSVDKKILPEADKTKENTTRLSFFERLKKTRQNLSYGLSALIKGKQISEELYEDLETALLTADLGVETTNQVIEQLREESKLRELHDAGALKDNLKKILKNILTPCAIPLTVSKQDNRPYVILMIGVNGAGKTTTIGKLTEKYKSSGLKVMLAAGDTFRAAAVEQLKAWGAKSDVPVIAQPTGSDSASVLYDALNSAKAHDTDVLICDTAGRLQNKDNLMEELKKIVRVIRKIDENVPDEVLLVLDSTTGQNAVSQVKLFSEAVKVTGLVLTKLDGSAKGGVVFALANQFKIPVRFVGIGEKAEDLRTFEVDAFVEALFD